MMWSTEYGTPWSRESAASASTFLAVALAVDGGQGVRVHALHADAHHHAARLAEEAGHLAVIVCGCV
jgi:hypothetical protein